MPAYNSEDFIQEAVLSVVNQTFQDFVLIIVDDASTDKTVRIIKKLQRKFPHKIKLIELKQNLNCGGDKPANEGLKHATGRYVARMDADDVADPTRFEKQINFLKDNPHVFLVGSCAYVIDKTGKIIGEKNGKKNIVDKISDWLIELMGEISEMIYKLWGDIEDRKVEEKDTQFRMMNLKPRQKKQIEEIQEKVGKLGFNVKIRYVYISKKEVMNKNKVAYGFTGYMKQFNLNDLNSYKPDVGDRGTYTKVKYDRIFGDYRVNLRKMKLMYAYKYRSDLRGRMPHILNIEELASIWHFPVEASVKAPLIQKAPGRKAEPPSGLPVIKETAARELASGLETNFDIFNLEGGGQDKKPEYKTKREPPGNLPVI